MKTCSKCSITKHESEFYRDRYSKDGLVAACILCTKERNRKWREANPDYFKNFNANYRKLHRNAITEKARAEYYLNLQSRQARARELYSQRKEEIAKTRAEKNKTEEQKEKDRLRQKQWRQRNRSRQATIVSNWKKRNPQKAAAHALVLYAIRSGVIRKPKACETCARNVRLEGHHNDYLKPMEVQWLCKLCHAKRHKRRIQ